MPLQYRAVGYLSFGPIEKIETSACARRTGEAARVQWREGDVSAEHCLQCEARELAGVTRVRQARPLSARFASEHMEKT